VAAGDVATAAAWNVLTNDILQFAPFVQGVFTTEAARDAAITSPTEGMHVYLTAPTVPSGTGATITGVDTVYNGTNWVCVTPIGGLIASEQDIIGASGYQDLTTAGPTVTMVTGTSVILTMTARTLNNVATQSTLMSVAISGATTISAATFATTYGNAAFYFSSGNVTVTCSGTFLVTGLTPGTNTFKLQYSGNGNTSRWGNRHLTVTAVT